MKTLKALGLVSSIRAFAATLLGAVLLLSTSIAHAQRTNNTIAYTPDTQIVQGQMPLVTSYTLSITSPPTLTSSAVVTLNTSLFSPPPTGVSNSTALSFVAVVPNTVVFTGPSQTVKVQVVTDVPLGDWAGSFAYEITTSGWPAGLSYTDPGAFINSTYSAPPVSPIAPVVSIATPANQATYTLNPANGNISIPYTFNGNAPDGSPLTSLTGSVLSPSGVMTNLSFTPTGIGTPNASGSGSFSAMTPGIYTISTSDADANGNATASVQVTVYEQSSPPTVVINSPAANASIGMAGSVVDVPFTFTGTSTSGVITSITAELDGNPIAVTPSNLGNPVATGTGAMTITTTGSHTLLVTATDAFGTATMSESIVVTQAYPTNPSSITSNFNGTPVAMGDYIWFNSVIKVSGVNNRAATVYYQGGSVNFTVNGTPVSVSLPPAIIEFNPQITTASTTYDSSLGAWVTVVPASYNGNVFLSGTGYQLPGTLPGGINPVIWSGQFSSDTTGVTAQWQWAAAAYTSFTNNLGAIGVKAVDDNKINAPYENSDHAGSPENFLKDVIGGTRGGGGSNYTGSYSGTASVQ